MSVKTPLPSHSHASREERGLFDTAIVVRAVCMLLLQCIAAAQTVAETAAGARLMSASLSWAIDEVEPVLPKDMAVVVNGYNLGGMIDLESRVLPAVRSRSGAIVRFDHEGIVGVLR